MEKIILLLVGLFALIFLFTLSSFVVSSGYVEIPALSSFGLRINEVTSSLFDKPSPGDWIKEDQIYIYQDRIVIFLPNPTVSFFADTNSMDPSIDFTANGIEIKPQSPEQIQVGDIIVFKPNLNKNEYIVHRVIEIGTDELGWYCITKGDNALQNDGKIRWPQVEAVMVIIIY